MRKIIKGILGKLGYEIQKKEPRDLRNDKVDEQFDSACLSDVCKPNTVIDVGVGYGTYSLYNAYPKAKFILIEPLLDYAPAIEEIRRRYACEVVYKAVSDVEGVEEFVVDTTDLQKSSLSKRTALTSSSGRLETRTIDVTTLDAIFQQNPAILPPIVLKLDTEGHELKALKGGVQLLRRINVVIAEVSIASRFDGSYEFEDVVVFMRDHGFFLYTILKVTSAPGESRARFADIVFKRREE